MEAEANTADAKSDSRATETARKPAAEKQGVNGSASAGAEQEQEKDAASDAADELQKTKLEEDNAVEGSA